MMLKDLQKWKILDTTFDVFWHDCADKFDLDKRQFSSTNFITGTIDIFASERKNSDLWFSLWNETFRIIIDKMNITELSNTEDRNIITKQLAIAMNCMLQDNKLDLNQDNWVIMDTIFQVIWCNDWDCIDENERLYGKNDDHKSIIHIYTKDRCESEIWETLWHECMHSIIRKMPIKVLDALDDTPDQERVIEQLCMPFNKVMQENILSNLEILNFK